MIREDYLMRLIKQLVDFVARIAGHTKRGNFDEALDESNRAWDELLDIPRALVDRVDGPTLASMLKAARMRVAARLLTEEAKAHTGKQDPIHALLCYRRAFELYLEARALEPIAEDDVAIFELARMIPPGEIDPRYR